MRSNLRKLLVRLGLLDPTRNIDKVFEASETVFGFCSLVRCTVTYAKPGSDEFVGSGSAITARTLEKSPAFVRSCIERNLAPMPESVKLVVMLGATKTYVDEVRIALGGKPLFPGTAYAYLARGRPVIHVPHPSGGNNGAVAVFCGERAPSSKGHSEKNIPECRRQAQATMAALQRLWAERA